MSFTKPANALEKFIVCFMIFMISMPVWYVPLYRSTLDTVTITVTEKTVKRSGASHDRYIVFTDSESMEVTDSFSFWRFDSTDMYGRLKTGKTYRCEVAGWRWPFFSMYRNILSAQEEKSGER